MSGRYVIGWTNSEKIAGRLQVETTKDFPDSVQRKTVLIAGYWCIEISVDADDFERWAALP